MVLSSMSTEKRTSADGFSVSGLAGAGAELFCAGLSSEKSADTSIRQTINIFAKLRIRTSDRNVGLPTARRENTPSHCVGRRPAKTVNRKYHPHAPRAPPGFPGHSRSLRLTKTARPGDLMETLSENFYVERQIFLGVFAD